VPVFLPLIEILGLTVSIIKLTLNDDVEEYFLSDQKPSIFQSKLLEIVIVYFPSLKLV
jgi:hypothetical protein